MATRAHVRLFPASSIEPTVSYGIGDLFCAFTLEVSGSRDHDDVTNSHQQPIYSSVNESEDAEPHHESSLSSSSSPAAAAAAAEAAASSLPKYVHETPI